MAYSQEHKQNVRRLYVFKGLTLPIIAEQTGIPEITIRRWKKEAVTNGDDWDALKAANLLSGGSLEDISRSVLTGLVVQYQSTLDMLNSPDNTTDAAKRVELLASLADAFNKAIAASKRVLPETSQLATALEVMQDLTQFIKDNYPQHLGAFVEVLEPFGQQVAKKYGTTKK